MTQEWSLMVRAGEIFMPGPNEPLEKNDWILFRSDDKFTMTFVIDAKQRKFSIYIFDYTQMLAIIAGLKWLAGEEVELKPWLSMKKQN